MASTTGNAANVTHGTARIEIMAWDAAVIGTPLQNFEDIGYTEENVQVTLDISTEPVRVAEEIDPVDDLIQSRDGRLALMFKEFTLDNFSFASPEALHTLGSGLVSIGRKNSVPTVQTLGIRITPDSPEGFGRIFYVGHAVPLGDAAMAFSLQTPTLINAEFGLRRPSINHSIDINPTFTSNSTPWVEATGWAFSANAMAVTDNGTLTQTLVNLVPGTPYVVRMDISAFTDGVITPTLGGTAGVGVTAAGVGQEQVIIPGESGGVDIVLTSSGVTTGLTVDNVYVFPADIMSIFDETS